VEIIEKALGDAEVHIRSARIAVLGAAYKGGIDDTRESPAKHVVRELLENGANVVVYDPYTTESFGAERAGSLEETISGADTKVIITDHPEFKNIDLEKTSKLVKHRAVVDGRRVIEPHQAVKHGFKYYGGGYGMAFKP